MPLKPTTGAACIDSTCGSMRCDGVIGAGGGTVGGIGRCGSGGLYACVNDAGNGGGIGLFRFIAIISRMMVGRKIASGVNMANMALSFNDCPLIGCITKSNPYKITKTTPTKHTDNAVSIINRDKESSISFMSSVVCLIYLLSLAA